MKAHCSISHVPGFVVNQRPFDNRISVTTGGGRATLDVFIGSPGGGDVQVRLRTREVGGFSPSSFRGRVGAALHPPFCRVRKVFRAPIRIFSRALPAARCLCGGISRAFMPLMKPIGRLLGA